MDCLRGYRGGGIRDTSLGAVWRGAIDGRCGCISGHMEALMENEDAA